MSWPQNPPPPAALPPRGPAMPGVVLALVLVVAANGLFLVLSQIVSAVRLTAYLAARPAGLDGVLVGLILTALFLVVGVVELVLAWVLWRGRGRRRVARVLLTVLSVVVVATTVRGLAGARFVGLALGLLGLALDLAVLVLVWLPSTRRWYERAAQP